MTQADSESPVRVLRSRERDESSEEREAWQKLIDQLIDWSTSPSAIDEDEWQSPSIDAINRAYHLLDLLRRNSCAIPSRIVVNGEGGIVLERRAGSDVETFEIEEDGSVEYVAFANSRLRDRRRMSLES